jgi:SSS family transporter
VTSLDFFVMAVYFAAVLAIGVHFARQAGDAGDYFLGRHQLPWWAVMFSIVATETSALTVISIPGIGARSNLTWLQVTLGYLVGRIAVAIWLLPGYFRGEQETAYARLQSRFGPATRRLASLVFMVVRALADSVRVFASAIPLAIVTGWSIPRLGLDALATSVIVVGVFTLAYTWAGGIRAVVWVDVMQLVIYLVGGVATVVVAAGLAGGFGDSLGAAFAEGKLKAIDWTLSFRIPYTFASGVIGGALLAAASHGTDHLIVQRLLATKNLSHARKALVGSGVVVIGQFALFLLVGSLLWAAGFDDGVMASDEIYPRFVVSQLPPGLAGLVVAGILAAAMSTVSSSLNSLASATTHDFYASLTGDRDPRRLLTFGRWATFGWAVVLVGGALSFRLGDQPVVVVALSIASITYGGLLGTYLLGGLLKHARQPDAIGAILVATICMVVVVLVKPGDFLGSLAWPWYVPLGTLITFGTGFLSSTVRRLKARP